MEEWQRRQITQSVPCLWIVVTFIIDFSRLQDLSSQLLQLLFSFYEYRFHQKSLKFVEFLHTLGMGRAWGAVAYARLRGKSYIHPRICWGTRDYFSGYPNTQSGVG
jgi:hypothetical protein